VPAGLASKRSDAHGLPPAPRAKNARNFPPRDLDARTAQLQTGDLCLRIAARGFGCEITQAAANVEDPRSGAASRNVEELESEAAPLFLRGILFRGPGIFLPVSLLIVVRRGHVTCSN